MTTHKELTIGLFGFGVVGEGLVQGIAANSIIECTHQKNMHQGPYKKEKCSRIIVYN